MVNLQRLLLLGRGILTLFACSLFFTPAVAQEDDGTDGEDEAIEEIITTGSRIKRDTFSTTTPIQVLDTEAASRIGITSITELMQKSTAVSGAKIDGSLNSNAGQTNASEAPPAGGIGSSCINLRGLGCERTLVLINGRRLGLAGIRGAPPQPDINLIPIGMVEAVDVLTGGLSTIYGADAVAGVVNVRLKHDFEGLQFTGTTELTDKEGGEIYQLGMVGGVGNDTGNITIGMEYSTQRRVTTSDRDYASCLRRSSYGMSLNQSGRIINNCSSDFPDNWLLVPWTNVATFTGTESPLSARDQGRLLYTPGESNLIFNATGLPVTGFSVMGPALPDTGNLDGIVPIIDDATCVDSGGDGTGTCNWYNRFRHSRYNGNDQYDREIADIWRPFERFSLVMTGHLDPGWGNNTEAYFEGYYFNRQNDIIAATEQIFPTVLGRVPVTRGDNSLIFFDQLTGLSVDSADPTREHDNTTGLIADTQNPMNPFGADAALIVTLDDVPQTFDVELQQVRLVLGFKGDIGSSGRWGYDVAASYDRASGAVAQPILLENQLFFATQTVGGIAEQALDGLGNPLWIQELDDDPLSPTFGQLIDTTTEIWDSATVSGATCGPRIIADIVGQFTQPDCVPADLLNESIGGIPDGTNSGNFSSQAERDYLVGNRTNRTVTELSQLMAYITGDLFDIASGGTVGTAFGVEFREDAIASQNSALGVLGLNAAENPLQEGETIGKRSTFDAYAEISAPLVVNASWANLVVLDAAVRFTDDENFGNETVYKVGALWDINDYLSVSSAFNTSFRAPNLREQFLADQAGALPGNSDPCHSTPFNEILPGPGKELLRANCLLSGVDPTILGTSFTVAIPTSVGGAAGLNPETSESFTFTLSASQPWSDRFDFDVALTYFDIEIDDTVRALDAGTIANKCYFSQPNLSSPFCNFVERDRPNAPPDGNFISFIRAGFVNTGTENTKGFDVTTRLVADIGRTSVVWSTGTTILSERLSQDFPPSEELPDGSAIVDNVGRIGNPETTFQSTLLVSWGNWDAVWQARYWDDTEFAQGIANPVITDVDGFIIGGSNDGLTPEEAFGNEFTEYQFVQDLLTTTEFGPSRAVTAAKGQTHHDLSLTYNQDNLSVTVGINNLTDEEPPLISQHVGPNRNNAVTSARYDQVGRSYFLRLHYGF